MGDEIEKVIKGSQEEVLEKGPQEEVSEQIDDSLGLVVNTLKINEEIQKFFEENNINYLDKVYDELITSENSIFNVLLNHKINIYNQDEVVESLGLFELDIIEEGGKGFIKKEEIENFIKDTFSKEIFSKTLTFNINLANDIVKFRFKPDDGFGLDGHYFIKEDEFKKLLEKVSEEEKQKIFANIYRGSRFIDYKNSEGYLHLPMPIYIWNQEYDLKNIGLKNGDNIYDLGLEFLEGIPKDELREKYILGTISHEIGHAIYAKLINNKDLFFEWKELVDSIGNITKYSNSYEEETGERDYNENFAEAVRIYTTNMDYLQENYVNIFNFIKDNFPEIKNRNEQLGLPKDAILYDKKLSKENLQKLLDQWKKYNELSKIEIPNNIKQRIEKGLPELAKGTLIHGTSFDLNKIKSIKEKGIISGELLGIHEDSETHYCADFFRVEEENTIKDYIDGYLKKVNINGLILSTFESMALSSLNNNKISFIINVENQEIKELLNYDLYLDENYKKMKNIANRRGKSFDVSYERLSAILGGIPSNFISGIILSKKISDDFEKIQQIRDIFGNDIVLFSVEGQVL